MSNEPSIPVIGLLAGGGYRVHYSGQPDIAGTGATLPQALQALSAEIARRYETEKGDETAAARDAARQTDIIENDRFILGNKLQHNVMLGAALGLI